MCVHMPHFVDWILRSEIEIIFGILFSNFTLEVHKFKVHTCTLKLFIMYTIDLEKIGDTIIVLNY